VTLDDVAHLAPHPYHGPGLNRDLAVYRAEFGRLFRIVSDLGMAVFLTSDAIPCSAGVLAATGGRRTALDGWSREILLDVLDAFPEVRGIILRIGESDGTDVRDALRSRLHLRNSGQQGGRGGGVYQAPSLREVDPQRRHHRRMGAETRRALDIAPQPGDPQGDQAYGAGQHSTVTRSSRTKGSRTIPHPVNLIPQCSEF
jgi:hypothetical protein